MLAMLQIPRSLSPQIVGSAGRIAATARLPAPARRHPDRRHRGRPAGARLFGQACFATGDAEVTYGTGAFVLANIGDRPLRSRFGLLTSVGWKIGSEVRLCARGSAFIAGAAVQWLRDGLGLIKTRGGDRERSPQRASSSEGVTFVPALSGLGAPYWDPDARGIISGVTRGRPTAAHLARATLEGIALSVTDLVRAMADDLGHPLRRMCAWTAAPPRTTCSCSSRRTWRTSLSSAPPTWRRRREARQCSPGSAPASSSRRRTRPACPRVGQSFQVEMSEAARSAHLTAADAGACTRSKRS